MWRTTDSFLLESISNSFSFGCSNNAIYSKISVMKLSIISTCRSFCPNERKRDQHHRNGVTTGIFNATAPAPAPIAHAHNRTFCNRLVFRTHSPSTYRTPGIPASFMTQNYWNYPRSATFIRNNKAGARASFSLKIASHPTLMNRFE